MSKMKLSEFIKDYVEPNTLVRLWYPIKGGHTLVAGKKINMSRQIVTDGLYTDNEVIGVTDILNEEYSEAVNIVIKEDKHVML